MKDDHPKKCLRTRGAEQKKIGARRHAMPPAHAGSDVKQLGELAVREVAHARPELALALLRVEPLLLAGVRRRRRRAHAGPRCYGP